MLIQEYLPGEEYTVEHRVVRPDGQVRWIRGRGLVRCGVRGPGGGGRSGKAAVASRGGCPAT